MQNYKQFANEDGIFETPAWVIKQLTDLGRFTRSLDELRHLITSLEAGTPAPDWMLKLERLCSLSRDLYDTWDASNTELISGNTEEIILEWFTLCRRLHEHTWPAETWEFLELLPPEPFKVYRGQSKSDPRNQLLLAWTLREDFAEHYAGKYVDGVVLEKTVTIDDVLAIHVSEQQFILKG